MWYVALAEKNRRGPTAPQMVLVLKCVRENGQVNPLGASAVHMSFMCVRAQLRTPTWASVAMQRAASWTAKRSRGGI